MTDVVLDIVVGVGYIQDCHLWYGTSVLAFFWLPGLVMGGLFSILAIGEDILEKKFGSCGNIALFILGTILGPIIVTLGTLVYLVKAAINSSSGEDNSNAKL